MQDDHFDATHAITICTLTTGPTENPAAAPLAETSRRRRSGQSSSLMVDKPTTMPRSKLGERIGTVSDTDMLALSRALVVFLGIA